MCFVSLYFQCTFLTTCKNSASQMYVHANGKNGIEIELRYIWHVRSLFCVYVILILSRIKCVIWMFVPIEVGIAFVVKTILEIVCISPFIIWHSKVDGACQKQAMSKKCKTDFKVYPEIVVKFTYNKPMVELSHGSLQKYKVYHTLGSLC